jgi:hypothetical protein
MVSTMAFERNETSVRESHISRTKPLRDGLAVSVSYNLVLGCHKQ